MMSNSNDVLSNLPIFKAAVLDDWKTASEIFKGDPDLMTKPITIWNETPLIVAVGTNSSHSFVKKLVERIVAVGAKDRLFETTYEGNNALHYAAKVGNTTDAKLLVEQNSNMTLVANPKGFTPLKRAVWHENKETLKYLLKVTPNLPLGEEGKTPYTGVDGGDLITLTIMARFYDLAYDIINEHPNIVLEENWNHQTALQILAQKPEVFPSGNRLGLWGRFIISLIPMKKSEGETKVLSRVYIKCTAGFWRVLRYMVPSFKRIHDIKVNNNLSNLLVDRACEIIIKHGVHNLAWNIFGSTISIAVKYGTYELIEKCALTYPGIIWYEGDGSSVFLAAIKQRQQRVYNLLVFQTSGFKVFASTQVNEKDENALHIAARLAPLHRLKVVTGAALQMQRELQWFQEVKRVIDPSSEEDLNKNGETPRMVFDEAHKELLKEGQQWMKDTASSCTVVAALIVTMTFAAIFAVPGGNQEDGKPLYLNYKTFMLFIISDAMALFSSSTSVLMFLGILTHRCAEDDFLYALPKRLMIGLISLFMSIATSMIAFSSALALVLRDKVTWVAAPLIIATSIPVCLYALLQFPLLVEIVRSTYGKNIFHPQSAQKIY